MSTQPSHNPAGIPQWTIGDRLRKIRTTQHLKQSEFAAQLEVNEPTYSQWESNRATPRNVVALSQRIELLTGIPAAWTLGLNKESPSGGGPEGQSRPSAEAGPECTPRDSNPEPIDSGSVIPLFPTHVEPSEVAA